MRAMAKRGKLGKQLRKGARRVLGSEMVQRLLRDLVRAAVIAAAIKFRDSDAGARAAAAAKKKAKRLAEEVEAMLAGKRGGGKSNKRKD
jgi:hypothetical protein